MNNLKDIKITYKNFQRQLWDLDFFIFDANPLETMEKLFESKYNYTLTDEDKLNIYSKDDEESEVNIDDEDFLSYSASDQKSDFIAIEYNKSFDIYTTKAIDFYAKKQQYQHDEIIFVPNNLSFVDKAQFTLKALSDEKIKLIIGAQFGYMKESDGQNNYWFVTNPLIFDKNLAKIVYLKYSSKLSGDNYLKAFYDFQILKSLKINVNDISLIAIDSMAQYYMDTTQDNPPYFEALGSLFSNSKPTKPKSFDEMWSYEAKVTGKVWSEAKRYGADRNYKIIDFVASQMIPEGVLRSKKNEQEFNYDKVLEKVTPIIPGNFTQQLSKLISVYKQYQNHENTYETVSLAITGLKDFKFESAINSQDDEWCKYKYWENKHIDKDVIAMITKLLFGHNFRFTSSMLFAKSVDQYNPKKTHQLMSDFQGYKNFVRLSALNVIKKMHEKDKRIIWYDYEGFSSILPIVDGAYCYQQIVNQVSIIETINGKTERIENYIFDTNKTKLIELVKFIKYIYSNKADLFVVFNKNYENIRNNEILSLVKKHLNCRKDSEVDPGFYKRAQDFQKEFYQLGIKDENEFHSMVMHINNNTIDLMDCFRPQLKWISAEGYSDLFFFEFKNGDIEIIKNSEQGVDNKAKQLMMVFLRDMNWSYSIKKVEYAITKNRLPMANLIKPYKTLTIQKGTMAMHEAIQRYLGNTKELSWNQITPFLLEYCENDVKAMIMVYEFIMFLFRKITPEISNFEYNINPGDSDTKNYVLQNGKLEFK
ncbi:UU173 family protein [Mycoplasma sp. Ms02]|uniref:UU173 family protein n=1 Tax=Mycoplasma sp. Ms02 TaxID=353851 RepID=UPI001C89DCD0|nr:DUF2779 domain-containing protein [Mycoplasma sp. Ms02]QZE12397.1 DUF2779 domain-containing protein [Mycoplasma sp. Ms02]